MGSKWPRAQVKPTNGLHRRAQKGLFCNLIHITDQIAFDVMKRDIDEHRGDPVDITDDSEELLGLSFEVDCSDER